MILLILSAMPFAPFGIRIRCDLTMACCRKARKKEKAGSELCRLTKVTPTTQVPAKDID